MRKPSLEMLAKTLADVTCVELTCAAGHEAGEIRAELRKAAQAAAWFLRQAGGRMPHLKLMYLADRAALDEFGFPITGDRAVSMPQGPVLSMTLNLVNGDIESGEDGWESWISDRADHEVALREILDGAIFARVCKGLTESRFVAPEVLAFYQADS